jgi:hypothetical protein
MVREHGILSPLCATIQTYNLQITTSKNFLKVVVDPKTPDVEYVESLCIASGRFAVGELDFNH